MALKNGSRGKEVSDLQELLEAAGFSPGKIDGIFGPKTEAALRAYQAANDLTVDGIYGKDTAASFGSAQEEPEDADDPAGEGPRMSLPGAPELWKIGGEDWLVYLVPDTDPPIYMAWKSPSPEDTQSFFGPDQPIVYDNIITTGDFDDPDVTGIDGLIDFGSTTELASMDDDPFASWVKTMETEAKSQPWIMDDDYQSLVAMAMLEGRKLTDAEIESTGWWKNNTEGQREWMKLYHGDPMEAQRRIDDNRDLARQNLVDAGVTGFSDELVNFMADKVTKGEWSSTYYSTQLEAFSDPSALYELDDELVQFQNVPTIEHDDTVRDFVNKWLGPAFSNWSDAEVASWAGELRNDPNGEQRLVESLKNQRLALFPEYEDRNLSYEDISSPWRNYATNIWGQAPDETSDFFQQLIRNNDSSINGQLLRREGFNQKIGKVLVDANKAIIEGMGGSVRRPVG